VSFGRWGSGGGQADNHTLADAFFGNGIRQMAFGP
jgi:hypothetical protein